MFLTLTLSRFRLGSFPWRLTLTLTLIHSDVLVADEENFQSNSCIPCAIKHSYHLHTVSRGQGCIA